jgi:hypothetical protein
MHPFLSSTHFNNQCCNHRHDAPWCPLFLCPCFTKLSLRSTQCRQMRSCYCEHFQLNRRGKQRGCAMAVWNERGGAEKSKGAQSGACGRKHLRGAESRKKNAARGGASSLRAVRGQLGAALLCLGGSRGLLLCNRLPQHSHNRLEGKPLGDVLACSTQGWGGVGWGGRALG